MSPSFLSPKAIARASPSPSSSPISSPIVVHPRSLKIPSFNSKPISSSPPDVMPDIAENERLPSESKNPLSIAV